MKVGIRFFCIPIHPMRVHLASRRMFGSSRDPFLNATCLLLASHRLSLLTSTRLLLSPFILLPPLTSARIPLLTSINLGLPPTLRSIGWCDHGEFDALQRVATAALLFLPHSILLDCFPLIRALYLCRSHLRTAGSLSNCENGSFALTSL